MRRLFLLLVLLVTSAQAPLPSGYLSTSGSQIVDGLGNRVRLACTQYKGGSVAAPTDMPLIRAAGFNCVRIGWRDAFQASPPATNDCSGNTRMDACIAAAAAAGLKVILDHQGNQAVATSSLCFTQQQNGLWYDLDAAAPYNVSGGVDGCGNTGTISYAVFKANTVALATRYAGNPTVIGIDLHSKPFTFTTTSAAKVNWGGGVTPPPPTGGPGTGPAFQNPGVGAQHLNNGWVASRDISVTLFPNGNGHWYVQFKNNWFSHFGSPSGDDYIYNGVTAVFLAQKVALDTPDVAHIDSVPGLPAAFGGPHIMYFTAGNTGAPVEWTYYAEQSGFTFMGAVVVDFNAARGDHFDVTPNLRVGGVPGAACLCVIHSETWGSWADFSQIGAGWAAFVGYQMTLGQIGDSPF